MNAKKTFFPVRAGLLAAMISQLFASNSWAASDAERIAELEARLANSQSQLARLAQRLDQLEAGRSLVPAAATPAQPAAPAPAPAAQEQRIDALERNLAQVTDAAARAAAAPAAVPLHGFFDTGYARSSKAEADGRRSGFMLGNFDLYLTPDLGGSVKSLVELNFEYGDEGTLATDLERIQLGYTFSDGLTAWLGRFHTPYGYWNTAFHHGAQIQTAVSRPKMIAFEDQGGVLPAHVVGAWATGQFHAGSGKLEYDAYVGNGNRVLDGVLDFNAVKDDNGNKLMGGNVRYRFGDALDGLVLGLHGFRERVNAYDERQAYLGASKVNMLGGYGYYDGNDWEVISEYYRFRNSNQQGDGARHGSWTGFLQVGKNIGGNITPYVRTEKAALDQGDLYFAAQASGRSYRRQVAGVRYDLTQKAALKLELRRSDETADGGSKYNEAQVQAAVRF